MKKCVLLPIVLLAFTIPSGLCAVPLPEPWPPEPEWHPVSPGEAFPDMTRIPVYHEWTWEVEADTAFLLYYGWAFNPTNVGYLLEDCDVGSAGDEVEIKYSLQGRNDVAIVFFDVELTMQCEIDGEPLEPTGRFRAMWEWSRGTNLIPGHEEVWVVVPRSIVYFYYIECPEGLPAGEYVVHLHIEAPSDEDRVNDVYTTLVVV